MPKSSDFVKAYRNVKVKLSDNTVITGKINIRDFQRLSDYLRSSGDRFITVIVEGEGSAKKEEIIVVNREHIIWAETWD